MVSVERDTMTNILDGSGNIVSKEKLNAAYPLGYNAGGKTKGLETGVSYAMKTIGEQTGINIDNFITMNFDGLINLVNDVGGIDVYNDPNSIAPSTPDYPNPKHEIFISDTEPQYTVTIPAGEQHLNGEQALVYSRDRHHRVGGDYGRQIAQRQVIEALMKKMLSLDNITQYQKILNDASKDFKTNIPINASTISSLLGYKDCFKKVISIQARGVGNMVDGVSYEFFPQDVYLAMQNAMRRSLGESTLTVLPSNLITYESYFGTASTYYLPSATVTENGKSTTYGIDTEGNFVNITSQNQDEFISGATGSGGEASTSSSSSGTSSSSSTASSSSLDSTTSDTNSGSGTSSNDSSSYGNNTGTYTGQ
ncbi:LCP family protein [Lactococcus protaetiae]|uniref:LCP family protein n=1 Tax=Lactococcus protaetiae TaxID=2592653 RepID=UPI001FDA2CDE|nr:LCP family protein [Lactococcus protaetiae]